MKRIWEEKQRLNVTIPTKLLDRLVHDSIMYGISKSSIVENALVAYYRNSALTEAPPVSSGKPQSGDTP